jgi:hypothetical protein
MSANTHLVEEISAVKWYARIVRGKAHTTAMKLLQMGLREWFNENEKTRLNNALER